VSLAGYRGPFGSTPNGRFNQPLPDGLVYVEAHPRRVRGVTADGRTVIDTEHVSLVHRAGEPPYYAFPADAVGDLPSTPEPEVPGHVRVPWDAVEEWWEEDDRIRLHAPNPYHRVDIRSSPRRVRVVAGSETLVDGAGVMVLYETAMPPRIYIPKALVRMDLLVPTETATHCPYKGDASYWSARVDGETLVDVAWSYESPHPESLRVAAMLSFDTTKVTVDTDLPGG
jgi:uncharacterized protein (DUF427 family)